MTSKKRPIFPIVLLCVGAICTINIFRSSQIVSDLKKSFFVAKLHSLVDNESDVLLLNAETTQKHRELHSTNVAVLNLTDWEMQSLLGIAQGASTCITPQHVEDFCCLGPFSVGGKVNIHLRQQCNRMTLSETMNLFNHVEQQFQAEFRLPKTTTTTQQECDICQIVELSRKFNLKIGFLGDPISTQIFQGLICELQRRNYKVTMQMEDGKHAKTGGNIWGIIRSVETLTIHSTLWDEEDDENSKKVTIQFIHQYNLPYEFPDEVKEVARSSDVLITNFGLLPRSYARTPEKYVDDMYTFYHDIQKFGKKKIKLLLHRESTAVHYDSKGGEFVYLPGGGEHECKSHQDIMSTHGSEMFGWREKSVRKAALKANLTVITANANMPTKKRRDEACSYSRELIIIPYLNFTLSQHKMHPQGICDSYCSSPYLYQPIWRSLRLAMDREFGSGMSKVANCDEEPYGDDQEQEPKEFEEKKQLRVQQAQVPKSNVYETVKKEIKFVWPKLEYYGNISNQNRINRVVDDIHNSSIAVVDLLDWEIQSLNFKAPCNPPNNIPQTCCLGSASKGGDVTAAVRSECINATMADFVRLRNDTIKQMMGEMMKISTPNNNRNLESSQLPDDTSSSPFSTTTKTTTTALECDVCQIIEIARQHNLRVSFFGDSMSTQVYHGFICELYRRNYLVEQNITDGRHENVHGLLKNWNIRRKYDLFIRSPTWDAQQQRGDSNSGGKTQPTPPVHMKFYFQYKIPFLFPDDEMEVLSNSDVLVTNFGLHWKFFNDAPGRSPANYTGSYAQFLNIAKGKDSTIQLLLHRETSAQHFDYDGGEHRDGIDWGKRICTAVNRSKFHDIIGWREKLVSQAAKAANYTVITANSNIPPPLEADIMYTSNGNKRKRPLLQNRIQPELVILPYFDYSFRYHEFHSGHDCTHFCYSPFIFQTIWRGLRIAMDREYM